MKRATIQENANGTPNLKANYNRVDIDAGYGRIKANPETQFNPANCSSSPANKA
ncbi:MAG: hypothetical protein NTW84_03585 [Methanothrix sp.]|nr:hypothetical protein [Methanothrix sp.]